MPVPITPTDLTNVATEFTSVPTGTTQMFIDNARPYVSEGKWGDNSKLAIILMAAHFMSKLGLGAPGSGGAQGPVVMEKVGDLQRQYAQVAVQGSLSDQLLAQTVYGQQFIMMRKRLTVTPMVI